MKLSPLLSWFSAAVTAAVALAAPVPSYAHTVKSPSYQVEVDGREVFTEKFADLHCASFTHTGVQEVTVRSVAPITSFNVSPHSTGIAARADGTALRFKLDRPRHLVVTINGGEELLLFAEPPDPAAPQPGQPGVTNVQDLGIDATGQRIETARLQQAIDRVAAADGVLFFPRGTYLTGTLTLKSNLTVYLADGARLLGSTDPADYPVDDDDGRRLQFDPKTWKTKEGVDVVSSRTIAYTRLILVKNAQHVRVAGRGVIDGQGKLTRRTDFRPQLVHIRSSSDITFEDVTLRDAAFYNSHVLMSDRVTYRNVKILSNRSVPNTDGFNPDSSQDVLVDGCFLLCGDDTIAIKSSGHSGLLRNVERITVRNSQFISTTSAMKMGTESFADYHRDVTFENNDVILADRAINLSCTDGAKYENIRFIGTRVERIDGKRIRRPFAIHIDERTPDGRRGWIRGVLLKDFSIEHEGANPSRLTGLSAQSDVRNIRFENFSIAGRVRLDPVDANFQVDPFVSGLTFAATPQPPNPRSVPSASYRVEIDGREIFTEKFADIHHASFTQIGTQEVTVRTDAPVATFNVSPHSAGIAATADGTALRFKLDRPRYLVVTVNGGDKLFLFAEPPEPIAPRPGQPGVISVLDFGVDATGARLETARLQQAIDQVAAAGSTLYFPRGTYLTGMLSLKSNLTLYLAEGARLLGSAYPEDYPPDDGFSDRDIQWGNDYWTKQGRLDAAYRRLIFVNGQKNVRVMGPGTIQGRGRQLVAGADSPAVNTREQLKRSAWNNDGRGIPSIMFVTVLRSSHVTFEGITLLDSPGYNAHVVGSDHVTFRRIKLVSDQQVPNTDGIDPDSSRDVLIENSFLYCADDCVSVKTSGQSLVKGDSERITVRNCVFISKVSGTKIGNETFVGSFRDILFENNDILEAGRAFIISIMDGNAYENFRFIDNRIEKLLPIRTQFPVHVHVRRRSPEGKAGKIRGILFQNLSVEEEYPQPSKLRGLTAEDDVRDVRFVNYTIAGKVRLNAADANVEIGPFVSDVTFSGPPGGG